MRRSCGRVSKSDIRSLIPEPDYLLDMHEILTDIKPKHIMDKELKEEWVKAEKSLSRIIDILYPGEY